jgi:hypothetical protein
MIYSGWVFYNTFFDFIKTYQQTGSFFNFVAQGYRDEHWDNFFGYYAWTFYVSKYYEFIDTWIILYKSGKPGSLQIIHHIGAVITMWLITASRNPGTWIFVVFNSGIHTLMYFYYCLTTLGFRPKWKILLTVMQITQFLVGTTVSHFYLGTGGVLTPTQVVTLSITNSYVYIVFLLFAQFFFESYVRKGDVNKEGKVSKKEE